jgi:predicted phage tail protein
MSKPTKTPSTPSAGTAEALKHHPARVGSIVWGAILAVVGVLMITARQAGLSLDAGQTAMWLLFGAGLAMVLGGAVSIIRRSK